MGALVVAFIERDEPCDVSGYRLRAVDLHAYVVAVRILNPVNDAR